MNNQYELRLIWGCAEVENLSRHGVLTAELDLVELDRVEIKCRQAGRVQAYTMLSSQARQTDRSVIGKYVYVPMTKNQTSALHSLGENDRKSNACILKVVARGGLEPPTPAL